MAFGGSQPGPGDVHSASLAFWNPGNAGKGRGRVGGLPPAGVFVGGGWGAASAPRSFVPTEKTCVGCHPSSQNIIFCCRGLGVWGQWAPVSAGLGCGVPGLFLPPKRMEPTEMGFRRWLRDLLFVDWRRRMNRCFKSSFSNTWAFYEQRYYGVQLG